MFYRQTKLYTKIFILAHALFFISCQSTPNKEEQTHIVKRKSLQYLPYTEGHWKIIRQEATYEDGTRFSTISSLWILDNDFPLEFVTLDDLNPEDHAFTAYTEGDKIILRSTGDFYPAAESLSTNIYDNDFAQCNEDEFRMFARISSDFNYSGVIDKKKAVEQRPWFKYGNVICVRIEKDISNKLGGRMTPGSSGQAGG
jgi:hypothetical protein